MKIYTKTGDQGQTSLMLGGRVSKDSLEVEAYGTLDELNASIGLALIRLEGESLATPALLPLKEKLIKLQHELFDCGALLATPPEKHAQLGKALLDQINDALIKTYEAQIDEWTQALPELKAFIMPGGPSPTAAALHFARTICRRAERRVISLFQKEPAYPKIPLIFLNRLSDWLFVAARWVNSHQTGGHSEDKWTPAK